MGKHYYVDKTTNTPADTLLAFGLAQFLMNLTPYGQRQGLRIQDAGDCFEIELDVPFEPTWVQASQFFILFKGLETGKKKPDLPPDLVEDYQAHQQRNQAFYEALNAGYKTDELRDQGITPPVPDWPVWAQINQMSAVDAFNRLAETWAAHRDCFPQFTSIILNLFENRPNDYPKAEQTWKDLAQGCGINTDSKSSQVQVVNPGMGKGGNRSKADGLGIGGLKDFWIPEYLKFAGFFTASLPRTVQGSKDRKTYILRPKALTWRTHQSVFHRFQETLFKASAVKMDILAVLRYCQVFLEQWKEGQGHSFGRLISGKPGDHVEALQVVYYKYLGSAHATLNISELALPAWLGIVENENQADLYLALLEEHIRVVRSFEEKFGDDYEMLRQYRDFLSARDLKPFFEFARRFSHFLMSRLNSGKYANQFTIQNLEVLLMATESKLSPILQNQGFLNIASAIRRSTVLPQYQKAKGRDSLYQIRYGLGDKLLRHAQYRDTFIKELSGFIHDYNRENARKSETRKQQFRANITTQDMESIVELIDRFDAPTVAHLLVAYGYARDAKMGSDRPENQENEPEENSDTEDLELMQTMD